MCVAICCLLMPCLLLLINFNQYIQSHILCHIHIYISTYKYVCNAVSMLRCSKQQISKLAVRFSKYSIKCTHALSLLSCIQYKNTTQLPRFLHILCYHTYYMRIFGIRKHLDILFCMCPYFGPMVRFQQKRKNQLQTKR